MVSAFLKTEDEVKYQLLEDGTFAIDNYNMARPFSSFFPGIAGLRGIPMWVFYVNRGQGIASFGLRGKNNSIMEFQPANKAYNDVPYIGFRTFIKVKKGNQIIFYEPFQNSTANNAFVTRQKMLVRPEELQLEELNETLGLKITVRYFTLPQEPIAALVRVVELENIGQEELPLEVIDGLPKIIPNWMSNDVLKYMSHTAQAWIKVTNFAATGVPFYKLKVAIMDKPEVQELKEGNFYFGLSGQEGELAQARSIIDPELIFGEVTDYNYPAAFLRERDFTLPTEQFGNNKYPAAMSFLPFSLKAGAKQSLYSLIGHVDSESQLNEYFNKVKTREFFDRKRAENSALIQEITAPFNTRSSRREFDLYCRQTYLDNVLRGGQPVDLPAGEDKITFNVYSRKHGDLERDYNNYQISPTYYSQGDGNFRDINQNKRCDVFFNPKARDLNVLTFYNLVQLDGYNPLLVKGTYFIFKAGTMANKKLLQQLTDKKGADLLNGFFAHNFEPGSLLLFLEKKRVKLKVTEEKFLREIFGRAQRLKEAEHGEGFWTDHWTYNLDLLENYLAIYPEKEKEILLEKKEFTFYDNVHVVLPRSEKYVEAEGKIRQFGAVVTDAEKLEILKKRTQHAHLVRTHHGSGNIYHTTLLVKMICLLVNKLATLDADGIGMEMEADKPSWYDALNGLPGVFGSSVPETFELKRMIQFLLAKLTELRIGPAHQVMLPEEMARFLCGLEKLLSTVPKIPALTFWDEAAKLKEKYRAETKLGISGREKPINGERLFRFLELSLAKIDRGLAKAIDKKTGLYHTYYQHEAVKFSYNKNRRGQKLNHKGWPTVSVSQFKARPLPLFLEAEVHYLKTVKNRDKAEQLHQALKNSPLYDRELSMYKVNASLAKEAADIGRCTVFAPGWLENESVWLHMEYKYLLELLNCGLHQEFFAEFEKAGICFQKADVYGRSILENSSFIVSSAFPDQRMWGRGCVARLSGSTAEFIEIWILMTAGARPFRLDPAVGLVLEFKPLLPQKYFTSYNTFTCMFLGSTKLIYHNDSNIDTFAPGFKIKRIEIGWQDGGHDTVTGALILQDQAERVRNQEAAQIDIYF